MQLLISSITCALLAGSRVPTTPQPLLAATALKRAPSPLLQQQTEEKGFSFPLPFLQPGVPEDQQPTAELRNLKKQPFMQWAADEEYTSRLGTLYQAISLFLSLPVAYTTFYNLPGELPNLLVAANLGTIAAMIPFVIRLRVGWGFVSQRLKSRSTYYEANERGIVAKKDKGDLLRDKLLEQNEVAPVLRRIDASLLGLGLALVLSFGSTEVLTAIQGESAPATLKTLTGSDAIRFENRLKSDNEFAAEQQRRAQVRNPDDMKPAYCDSRYYKILAGGNGQGGVGCGGQQ